MNWQIVLLCRVFVSYQMADFRMSNTSGNITFCRPYTLHIFIPVFLSFIYSIGFLLNCISLWIFWFRIKQWNPSIILQFNLAISDTIIAPAAPMVIIYSFTDHWSFGNFACQYAVFSLSTNMYGGVYFLTLIALHRYFNIVHSLKWNLLAKKSFIIKLCLMVWGLLFLQGLPFFFLLRTSDIDGATKCLSIHQTEHALLFFSWNWVAIIFGLLLPFVITILCYSLLSKHILKANPMNPQSRTMISKSLLTIGVSLTIFIICYIPVQIARTAGISIKFLSPESCSLLVYIEAVYYFSWVFMAANGCIGPVLYCFASERFRKVFMDWSNCLYHLNERCRGISAQVASDGPPIRPNPTDIIITNTYGL
ncbi:P2Y purinoceptor 4 [Xenopus laevis]|uniref:P2Y purinoceptor 4 n=2 Tax=Xenopus laevis TaxID=8355 RepID=A0A8J0TFP0_XENLA|nr:P2Y purinoceptor 4 [Xenopus laevis]